MLAADGLRSLMLMKLFPWASATYIHILENRDERFFDFGPWLLSVMSISYQDKTIRQYLGMIAMVYKCPLVCLDHIYIGFCSRPDSSKDIFLAQEVIRFTILRAQKLTKTFSF